MKDFSLKLKFLVCDDIPDCLTEGFTHQNGNAECDQICKSSPAGNPLLKFKSSINYYSKNSRDFIILFESFLNIIHLLNMSTCSVSRSTTLTVKTYSQF